MKIKKELLITIIVEKDECGSACDWLHVFEPYCKLYRTFLDWNSTRSGTKRAEKCIKHFGGEK